MTAQQIVAIEALLWSETRDEAAKVAEVAPRTLYRWLADPEFQDELDRRTQEVAGIVRPMLLAQAIRSVEVICAIRDDVKAPAQVRLQAALGLLSRTLPDLPMGSQIVDLDIDDEDNGSGHT